jgi:hypothetical protein
MPAIMLRVALLALPLVLACADQIPDHIELLPPGEQVDIAYEVPSNTGYVEVGKVTGVAEGTDLESTHEAAKNDLRNKAAALGAVLVTIDQDLGEAIPLSYRTKVKLVGRAYKPAD